MRVPDVLKGSLFDESRRLVIKFIRLVGFSVTNDVQTPREDRGTRDGRWRETDLVLWVPAWLSVRRW